MPATPLPSPRERRITLGLTALHLAMVGLIVLSPAPVDAAGGSALRRALATLQRAGFPRWVDYDFVEFSANIVMFVPFGVFFVLLAPRGWRWLAPAVGFFLSTLIELTQLVFLPQRVASLYDVLANTTGALIGTGIAWLLLAARRRP
ncbi:VanZ family protein [Arthrobacter sp. RIT-PI-e]|uniref:VanZ family protein n=1 Tax=Arthrobacter sp. RIT-PI-e TaxID=1681197 RepID=UPI000676660A|nr:VanZ family protein [Arthrobacter sp. RIT-PI-e]